MKKKIKYNKKKQNRKKAVVLESVMRVHGAVTFIILAAYVMLGATIGSSVLRDDIRDKFAAAETLVSVNVIGLPETPIVDVASDCEDDVPVARVSWSATAATDYYNISKNGELLVSGLVTAGYIDRMVSPGIYYEYVVTAVGPRGVVSSQPVSADILTCNGEPPLPVPAFSVLTIDGKDAILGTGLTTRDNTPFVAGTVNIANALVQIETLPGPVASSSLSANINGYWEYTVPVELSLGMHEIRIIVRDPFDQNRMTSKTVSFEVLPVAVNPPSPPAQDDDKDKNDGEKKDKADGKDVGVAAPGAVTEKPAAGQQPEQGENKEPAPSIELKAPFKISILIENRNKIVYEGEELITNYLLKDFQAEIADKTVAFAYDIIDEKGVVVFTTMDTESVSSNYQKRKSIALPENIPFGKYRLRISTRVGGVFVSAESAFSYREMPVIRLGGMISFTYSQIISRLGWIALICLLLLLLIYLLLLLLEYRLYRESKRHITEKNLLDEKMISKRKGVLK